MQSQIPQTEGCRFMFPSIPPTPNITLRNLEENLLSLKDVEYSFNDTDVIFAPNKRE